MALIKLRIFSWSCISLAALSFVAKIFFYEQGHDDLLSSFFVIFLLIGSGMELVRVELKSMFEKLLEQSQVKTKKTSSEVP